MVCLVSGMALSLVAGCGGPGHEATTAGGGPRVIAGGDARRSTATLDVVDGATTVQVSSARSLGGPLYRVSTPAGSGIRPLVSQTGATVEVGQTGTSPRTGIPSLDIVVARGVRWTIDLDGGATTESVDMRRGLLSSLDFGAGVSRASVRLPAAVGTQSVTLAGGASQLLVVAPPGAPAQVQAVGGASQVLLDGADHIGVAGGSVFTDPGWTGSRNRYAIMLSSGVSDFRMSRS